VAESEREMCEEIAKAAERTADEYGGLTHFAFKRFAKEIRAAALKARANREMGDG
jgi:ribosomal protein L44E